MKPNKFIPVLSVLTLLVSIAGATFAYFASDAQSSSNAVSVTSTNINIGLDVTPLYTGVDLIPTNDSDIMTAYGNQCVDRYGNGACQAYTITVQNTGADLDYQGNITFNLNHITNLKYLVLDSTGNAYTQLTTITSGTTQSLGNTFTVLSGTSTTFTLIIWVPNFNYPQNTEDANGSFSAAISYISSTGSAVSGYISS